MLGMVSRDLRHLITVRLGNLGPSGGVRLLGEFLLGNPVRIELTDLGGSIVLGCIGGQSIGITMEAVSSTPKTRNLRIDGVIPFLSLNGNGELDQAYLKDSTESLGVKDLLDHWLCSN